MSKFAICLTLKSVLLLAGCTQTGSVVDGVGYELLTPNAASRTFITENDPTFRDQVAGHNVQCRKDKGCRK